MMNHFPSQRKSFTQKGKTWRRDCVDYVCSEADNYQTSNYKRMFENYQMYLDQLNQDDYRSWADPLDLDSGQSKDYVYAFNMAHNKIKIHLGEELQRPFYYSAISLNPEDSNEIIRQRNNDYKQYLQLIIDKEIEKIQLMQKIEQEAQARSGLTNAELKKMEGNAKIIKLIARDENVHLGSTQTLLKLLPQDDPDYASLKEETRAECEAMFLAAAAQEKAWAHYLFKDGSMIGLNEQLLSQYVDWLTCKRMTAVGLNCGMKPGSNPLPWTAKWIAGAEVQVAPQETEISSYVIGGTKQDVDGNTFKGFSL